MVKDSGIKRAIRKMKLTKLTQARAVFYLLWKTYQKNPKEFMPTWRALGELEVPELGEVFFMSYKTPANGFNIFFQNPDLIEREWTEGRSGAKYFTYRLKSPFLESNIVEKNLRDFYMVLTGKSMDVRVGQINLF